MKQVTKRGFIMRPKLHVSQLYTVCSCTVDANVTTVHYTCTCTRTCTHN